MHGQDPDLAAQRDLARLDVVAGAVLTGGVLAVPRDAQRVHGVVGDLLHRDVGGPGGGGVSWRIHTSRVAFQPLATKPARSDSATSARSKSTRRCSSPASASSATATSASTSMPGSSSTRTTLKS